MPLPCICSRSTNPELLARIADLPKGPLSRKTILLQKISFVHADLGDRMSREEVERAVLEHEGLPSDYLH